MLQPPPLVTVLMPVYNTEAYLRESIESILRQTFTDFEFLIIDDASTDDSLRIIQSYSDPRIKLVRNPTNLKLIDTLNKGIMLAAGKYIARMDADDISMPDRINKQVAFMEANPGTGICGTFFEHISKDGQTGNRVKYATADQDIRFRHLYQIQLCHGTSLIRAQVLKDHALFFDKRYIHAEDFEFWTRVSRYCKLANIPEVLYKVRLHDTNVSVTYKDEQAANTREIQKKQFSDLFEWTLSDLELDTFLDIVYSTFTGQPETLDRIEGFLIRWQKQNEIEKAFPTEYLNGYIALQWFHFCYNASMSGSTVRRRYFGSPLPGTAFYNRLKLMLKTLL